MTRVQRAFLLAPLVVPLLYWAEMLGEAAIDPYRRGRIDPNAWGSLELSLAFGGPVAYAAALLVGVPAYRLLRRTPAFRAEVFVALGAVTGVLVAWALAPWLLGGLFSIRLGVLRGGLLGAAAAVVWWYLARDRGNVGEQ
jgi:hypothetical protein